MATADTALGAV